MLPLSLLRSATNYPILVELKNGETFNGQLSNIDLWMNVNLKDAVRTSKDGSDFWRIPEVYIRGNTIKYLRIPDAVVDAVADEKQARDAAKSKSHRSGKGKGRGRGSGRHRGGGRSGVGNRG